jgi:ABC-type phosphate transport system permease subunit
MSWLERIRSKPIEYKIRLIWIVTGSVAALLIIAWILFSIFFQGKEREKDTKLFDTFKSSWNNAQNSNDPVIK